MATEAEIAQVRRRIGDSRKVFVERHIGNGEQAIFKLEKSNVFDLEVKINNVVVTEDYALNDAGQVIFTTAPSQGDNIDFSYAYAGYTDNQLKDLINTYGVDGTAVECLHELLADSAKFYDYSQGQTTDKRSQIFDHLKDLLEMAENSMNIGQGEAVLGKRHLPRGYGEECIDLSRDDGFRSQVDGYSNNNV